MSCRICRIKNKELLQEIEKYLMDSRGILDEKAKRELTSKYSDSETVKLINSLTDEECEIHLNFHMSPDFDVPTNETDSGEDEEPSLTKDINKSEASILFKVLTKQTATFNLITNKINNTIKEADDLKELGLPNNLLTMYKDITQSIRDTARTIKEINADVNGSKSGALEGLRALAAALQPSGEKSEEEEDLTTDEYDY